MAAFRIVDPADRVRIPATALKGVVEMDEKISIAIPGKGRLSEGAKRVLAGMGIILNGDSRAYAVETENARVLLARAKDVPVYVSTGKADLGITGLDLVLEADLVLKVVGQLPFGFCKLVFAKEKNSILPTRKTRIATKFPKLSRKYAESKGLNAEIVSLDGAVELSIRAGTADAIVDIVQTGNTLKENDLETVEEILASNAVLVSSNTSQNAGEKEKIDRFVSKLFGGPAFFKKRLRELTPQERNKFFRRAGGRTSEVENSVREIIEDVRKRRDEAVSDYCKQFDKIALKAEEFRVSREEIVAAYSQVGRETVGAIQEAAKNISDFSKREVPEKWEMKVEGGFMGKKIVPIDAVGVYVPGGTAAYFSTALMGIIPAKAAGVKRIVMCTPASKDGSCNPAVLVAADIAGADEIYRVGGAQAIAAMALGTRRIPKVFKIVGPGNIYVSTAKQLCLSQGLISIDSPAGPTEVVVIADETANPKFIAADLLAQAEHDVNSSVLLLTTSERIAVETEKEISKQIIVLPRREIASKSLEANGAIMLANNLEEAVDFSNEFAPEHLELAVEKPFKLFQRVVNAGTVFLGEYSCEAAGDYAAGPNHIIPTAGNAKSYSPLSAGDFVKQMNYLKLEKRRLESLRKTIVEMAEKEGLQGHANSVEKRFEVVV